MRKKTTIHTSIDSKKSSSIFRRNSKKNETGDTKVLNQIKTSQKYNSRYSAPKKVQKEKEPSKSQIKPNASSHLTITSIDINYSKLVEEDKKKLDEIKEKLVRQKKLLEDRKNELNELKERNEKMKEVIYKQTKELDKIKTEKTKYENLNNEMTNKINEITQTVEQQRERQVNVLRRREIMMNYLMSMIMGLRQRSSEEYPNVDNMSYEELLALEERMGNVNKGLTKEQIGKLPKDKFTKNKYSDDKCIVCQYEFKNYEKVTVLPCKHCFHPDCIEQWLENQKVCPYCKGEVKI